VSAALTIRPGRPRDVHGTWWFVDHPDGRVTYTIVRRAEAGAPGGLVLGFEAADDAAALVAYQAWRNVQADRVVRNAERRSKWGPLSTGKLAT
jgi:hypothetical protein